MEERASLSRTTNLAALTIDVTAVFPQKLQGVRVVVFHRL